ncbi:C2H2-type zinc finger transcription factor [Rhizophagus clarus]|nr:C2H2-type zinc finger transcription factor [Rhizophagus clarus]
MKECEDPLITNAAQNKLENISKESQRKRKAKAISRSLKEQSKRQRLKQKVLLESHLTAQLEATSNEKLALNQTQLQFIKQNGPIVEISDGVSKEQGSSNESDSESDNGYTTPSPTSKHSSENSFTENEKIIITNVPSNLLQLGNLKYDMYVNNVNISAKFRAYVNEAISHANANGLYVESNTHEILSLSSILVLIPNSYSTKMVEVFGLQVLASIHHEYTPTLSMLLDTEIECIYRNVVKTCLKDSRSSAIDLLCANLTNRKELKNNFGFLMLDLIRTLPFDKIRNEPSELTLITNYLDRIMKDAFHNPDKYIAQWPNTALAESKIRKLDRSRTKQPDFVVTMKYQSQMTNVIYVGEVSGPSEKNNVYKNCLDLIRIGVFMKDCIDSAISRGAEIKILGFQCIAYKVDFYILDLRGEGVYTMNHIAQISIPETVKDLFAFIEELHVLLNIRNILLESYDIFIDKLENPGIAPLELKSSFKKNTLDTPEFNKLVSKTRSVKRKCPFWFGKY